MDNEGRQWYNRLGNGELPRRWTPRAATKSRMGQTKLLLVHSEEEKPDPREGLAGSRSILMNADEPLPLTTGDSTQPVDFATGNGSLSRRTVRISRSVEEGSNPTTQAERKAMKETNVPNVRKVRKDAREPHTQKPETESTPVNMGPSCGAIDSVGKPPDEQVASAIRNVGATLRMTGELHGKLGQMADVVICFCMATTLLWLWTLEARDGTPDDLAGMLEDYSHVFGV